MRASDAQIGETFSTGAETVRRLRSRRRCGRRGGSGHRRPCGPWIAGAHDWAEACAAEILRLCIALGGSITGEHGVGLEKRDFLAEQYGQADIDCMKRLQQTMDPADIANPGKVFAPLPAAEAAAAAARHRAAMSERVPS